MKENKKVARVIVDTYETFDGTAFEGELKVYPAGRAIEASKRMSFDETWFTPKIESPLF